MNPSSAELPGDRFTPAHARPEGGFELWAWLFMRVSGVLLLALALGHLVIMHLINNVDNINFAFVAARYRGAFWRAYDLALLLLALFHGLNGLRTICDDHLRGIWKRVAFCAVVIVGILFGTLGSWVILAFQGA